MLAPPVRIRRRNAPRTLYRRLAPVYDILVPFISSQARTLAQQWLDVTPGETVLDVGTGTGLALASLAKSNPTGWTEGLDATPAMVARARRRLKQIRHDRHGVRIGRASNLPYGTDQFDAVLSSYLIDVLPSDRLRLVIEELNRVLRPGGRLVLVYVTILRGSLGTLWRLIAKYMPALLGGARPTNPRPALNDCGFQVVRSTTRTQMGLRSAILSARA